MEVLMNCAFCGEEFSGRPIRQGDQVFCSIECADMAAEIGVDDDSEYFEEDPLDMNSTDDEMSASW
jgi:hypothetical protein